MSKAAQRGLFLVLCITAAVTFLLIPTGVTASQAETSDASLVEAERGLLHPDSVELFKSTEVKDASDDSFGRAAASSPEALLPASLANPYSWADPSDSSGLLDIAVGGYGVEDTTGELFATAKFWSPSWLYDLGFSDCLWFQLDTDCNTYTGWNFYGNLGIDYIISFYNTASGFFAEVIRTPSDQTSTWWTVTNLVASAMTLESGEEAIGTLVPMAVLGFPRDFRFIIYSSYLSTTGSRYGDFLPNQPGALSYHVPIPAVTTTTVAPTTTTTLPSTTTTTSPPSTTTTTLPSAPQFNDVPSSHPYSVQISDLASRQIINGFPNGTFQPDSLVTRQQFAKMVVKSLGLPVSESDKCPFLDVPSNVSPSDPLYPDHYVAVCAANGITLGKTPTNFAPFDSITRAQLITMVSRAADLPEPPSDYVPPFAKFDTTHYPFARKAASAGLLNGLQGIGPGYPFFNSATRGEVSLLLYNLLHR